MKRLTFVLAFVFLTAGVSYADLIVNWGFETADLTGWTVTPAALGSSLSVSSAIGPHTGRYSAIFGAVGSYDDKISQSFATTPSKSYTLTFWLSHHATDSANDFSAYWNGSQVLSLMNAAGFGYTRYSFTQTASGTSTTIAFAGREKPSWYSLDDVSVSPAISIPEPSTFLLLSLDLAALAVWGVRSRMARRT